MTRVNGFEINGRLFPLGSVPLCKVFDRGSGEQIEQVFYVNADTGQYRSFAAGPDGSRPCLNTEGDDVLTESSCGKLTLVFDGDPPAPLMRAMHIPV